MANEPDKGLPQHSCFRFMLNYMFYLLVTFPIHGVILTSSTWRDYVDQLRETIWAGPIALLYLLFFFTYGAILSGIDIATLYTQGRRALSVSLVILPPVGITGIFVLTYLSTGGSFQ